MVEQPEPTQDDIDFVFSYKDHPVIGPAVAKVMAEMEKGGLDSNSPALCDALKETIMLVEAQTDARALASVHRHMMAALRDNGTLEDMLDFISRCPVGEDAGRILMTTALFCSMESAEVARVLDLPVEKAEWVRGIALAGAAPLAVALVDKMEAAYASIQNPAPAQ